MTMTNRLPEKAGTEITELQDLLEKIYKERGFDFREYRRTTLVRRLARRLQSRGVETYREYAKVLQNDPAEYEKLFNYLTINVTDFFRDEVSFKVLEEIVLPTVISRNNECGKSFRIWSAGCSTGEEPYSVAILIVEFLGRNIKNWDVKILATDIDSNALECAEEGVFTLKKVANIRKPWLEKYFIPYNKRFQVKSVLRRLVVFENHNLVNGLPYRDIDLVVCRNVLIYFTPQLQSLALGKFYEAMKDGAFLFLGKAEIPGEKAKTLFECIDRKAKVYRKA